MLDSPRSPLLCLMYGGEVGAMDDQPQVIAVGFVLVIAVGAALAFGGIIDFPSADEITNPIQAIGINLDEPVLGSAPVELEIPSTQDQFNKETLLDAYLYGATVRSQSMIETQTQGNTQTGAKSHGTCGLGY